MATPKPTCEGCRFWEPLGENARGTCHYHAPTAKGPNPWPQTFRGNWCREWTAREEEGLT